LLKNGGLGLTHSEAAGLTLPQVWNLFRGFDENGTPKKKGRRAVKAINREMENARIVGANIRKSLSQKLKNQNGNGK